MNTNENNYKKLRSSLISSGPDEKTAIINGLRAEKPFEGVVLLIAEILENESDSGVLEAALRFLNDLKHQSLCQEVINAMNNTDNDLVMQKLTSSCWQSGLDYSEYLHHFIGWSVSKSYLVSLECYSLIEQWVYKAGTDKRNKWKAQLRKAQPGMNTDRYKLTEAIIDLLD